MTHAWEQRWEELASLIEYDPDVTYYDDDDDDDVAETSVSDSATDDDDLDGPPWETKVMDAMRALYDEAKSLDPAEMAPVIEAYGSLLRRLPWMLAAQVALLASSLVERGGSPLPFAGPVGNAVHKLFAECNEFVATWLVMLVKSGAAEDPALANEMELAPLLPNPLNIDEMMPTFQALLDARVEDAYRLHMAWFTADQWQRPLVSLLQHRHGRDALPHRQELADAIWTLANAREDLHFAARVLRVLDDEKLVVLHRPSGQGWELKMSGITDNFQLHTLLADRLVGAGDDMIPGEPPTQEQVAAATDGNLLTGMSAIFDLTSATGEAIRNDKYPADIPERDGSRVIVLDPLSHSQRWEVGRVFPAMTPSLELERTLTRAEAADWLKRVESPRER